MLARGRARGEIADDRRYFPVVHRAWPETDARGRAAAKARGQERAARPDGYAVRRG